MAVARKAVDAEPADYVRRVAAAARSSNAVALRRLRSELATAAKRASGTHERGVYDGLLGVVDSVQEAVDAARGLAAQSAPVEPGSLAARMLLEVAGGVRGANADLADRLDTDQWQISRAGRRLRELGLATRVRSGRLNGWQPTDAGEQEVAVLRGESPRASSPRVRQSVYRGTR
jgi:DNA-binding MarR family transcriptional regulator